MPRKKGIKQSAFFVVGFPDETLQEIKQSFEFASKINLQDVVFSYASPLPATELYDQAKKENLFIDGFDFASISFDTPNLKSKNWSTKELQTLASHELKKLNYKIFFRNLYSRLFRREKVGAA